MKPPASARQISIILVGPEDHARLADLHGLCFDPAWGRDSIIGIFAVPGALGLIARIEGSAVGFSLCRRVGVESELLALGVLPARRRGGIARALLDATIQALAKDGLRALFLEVAEDNAAGRALYDAAGFTAVGRHADFYRRDGAEPAAALILRREIIPEIRPSEGA